MQVTLESSRMKHHMTLGAVDDSKKSDFSVKLRKYAGKVWNISSLMAELKFHSHVT